MSKTLTQDLDRMLHPDEARERIFARLRRLPAEPLPISEAAWRVLACDAISRENHPPFPASTMDGYAVVAEDPSPWREIVGHQTAGYVDDVEVDLGTAAWITTGAPVPRGANAVVPVEATERAEDHVIIHQDHVRLGENIRPIGIDIAVGATVALAGTELGPAEIGLLAGLGFDPVSVVRRPRVSILSTGNELVEPSETPDAGQIRDSNRFSMVAAVQEAGGEVIWAGHGPDEMERLRATLSELIAKSDVVITSGGVSMGDLDLIKPLLLELADVQFRRVFMKPGKPFTFATAGETLIFSLPGNPVSTIVGFEVFIRPALRWMLGLRNVDRPRLLATLEESVRPSDRIEMQRGVVRAQDGRILARPNGPQASSRLSSFVGANALLRIPAGTEKLPPGTEVEALLTGPIAP